MKVRRKTIAKLIAVVFVFNLVVTGGGAWLAYQEAPPIPEEVVGPDRDVVDGAAGICSASNTYDYAASSRV